ADANRVELIEPGQRLDRRPRRPLALQIDGGSALMLTHQDWRDVHDDLRARSRAVVALRTLARLQDRQRPQRSVRRRVLDRFQAERRHERTATALDHTAAERLDLGDELVEVAASVDVDAKQRD